MIEKYLVQASTYAADIDNLVSLISWLVGFWGFLVLIVFFGLIINFRRREGQRAAYITGEEKHQKRWITIPHDLVLVCDIIIIVGAINVWYNVKQNLPEADAKVRVIGQQWAWSFQHPGLDGKLDTDDDIRTVDELHVEVGKLYHYKAESRDVLHSFSVPVFRLKQDVIPGRVISGWFEPTQTGTFDIQCAEMCGIGHGLMPARIVIESAAAHKAWMEANTPTSVASAK
ncbi:MAG: hypothetical protein OXU20_25405 [Myxococcales bacterium]|nr:hypothetical protein [Myxococcales bacterium]MDD9965913.1 hypothetical protein [Myxococcales bacterium]